MNAEERKTLNALHHKIGMYEDDLVHFEKLLNQIADALGMATSCEMAWDEEVECMINKINALKDKRNNRGDGRPRG